MSATTPVVVVFSPTGWEFSAQGKGQRPAALGSEPPPERSLKDCEKRSSGRRVSRSPSGCVTRCLGPRAASLRDLPWAETPSPLG